MSSRIFFTLDFSACEVVIVHSFVMLSADAVEQYRFYLLTLMQLV